MPPGLPSLPDLQCCMTEVTSQVQGIFIFLCKLTNAVKHYKIIKMTPACLHCMHCSTARLNAAQNCSHLAPNMTYLKTCHMSVIKLEICKQSKKVFG